MPRTPPMHQALRTFTATVAVAACSTAAAQRYVVVSASPTAPRTQLLTADTQAGTWSPISGFPSDGLLPLAVAHDPINGDAILALDAGGVSLILRVTTSTPVRERLLGTLPGAVGDLTVTFTGDIYATVPTPAAQAGLWRIPRQGGTTTLELAMTEPVSVSGSSPGGSFTTIAESGAPTRAVRLVYFDLIRRAPTFSTQAGLTRPIVAGLDLPTAVPRALFAHPDGSMTLVEAFANPTTVLAPSFGPGSARTLEPDFRGFVHVLGGAVHPFIKALPSIPQAGTPIPWNLLVGPLPGDPVDMDRILEGPAAWRFGVDCGLTAIVGASGRPALGNMTFQVELRGGTPSAPTLFALGFSESFASSAGGVPLPATLPSGCTLLVDPQVTAILATDPTGFVAQPIPIPNQPTLLGSRAWCQWLQWQGTPFETSEGLALEIGV